MNSTSIYYLWFVFLDFFFLNFISMCFDEFFALGKVCMGCIVSFDFDFDFVLIKWKYLF